MDTMQSPEMFIPNRPSGTVYNLLESPAEVVLEPNGEHMISSKEKFCNTKKLYVNTTLFIITQGNMRARMDKIRNNIINPLAPE